MALGTNILHLLYKFSFLWNLTAHSYVHVAHFYQSLFHRLVLHPATHVFCLICPSSSAGHAFYFCRRVTASWRFTDASPRQHYLRVFAVSRHATYFFKLRLKCSPLQTPTRTYGYSHLPRLLAVIFHPPPFGHPPPSSFRSSSTPPPGDHLIHPCGQLISLLLVKLIIHLLLPPTACCVSRGER